MDLLCVNGFYLFVWLSDRESQSDMEVLFRWIAFR